MVDGSLIDIKGGRYTAPIFLPLTRGNIYGGRHPLQERVVDAFVPNDTFMVGGAGIGASVDEYPGINDDINNLERGPARSVIVCTGANACGKSVYLKQVRLLSRNS